MKYLIIIFDKQLEFVQYFVVTSVQTISIYCHFLVDRPCNVRQIEGSVTVNTRTVEIIFSADDAGATFHCKLNKERFVACKYPKNIK